MDPPLVFPVIQLLTPYEGFWCTLAKFQAPKGWGGEENFPNSLDWCGKGMEAPMHAGL